MNCFHRTMAYSALTLGVLLSTLTAGCEKDIEIGTDDPQSSGGSGGASSGASSGASTTGGGGSPGGTTTSGGGSPGDTTTSSSSGGTPAPLSEFPPPACSAPEGPPILATSEMQFVGLLSRVWARCGEDILWTTSHDGMEFTSDGLWYLLQYKDGQLIRKDGFDTVGSWTLLDPSFVGGVYVPGKMQMDIFGAGSVDLEPAFIDSPLKLNLMAVGSDLVYAAVQ